MNEKSKDSQAQDAYPRATKEARPFSQQEAEQMFDALKSLARELDQYAEDCWDVDPRDGSLEEKMQWFSAIAHNGCLRTFTPSEAAEISALLNPVAADGDTTKGA